MAEGTGKDVAKALLGPGLTLIGWLTPVVVSLIGLGSSAAVAPRTAALISDSMFYFLVVFLLLFVHVLSCVITLVGIFEWYWLPAATFLLAFSSLMVSLLIWIANFLLGGLL